jgi:hypothetical protein
MARFCTVVASAHRLPNSKRIHTDGVGACECVCAHPKSHTVHPFDSAPWTDRGGVRASVFRYMRTGVCACAPSIGCRASLRSAPWWRLTTSVARHSKENTDSACAARTRSMTRTTTHERAANGALPVPPTIPAIIFTAHTRTRRRIYGATQFAFGEARCGSASTSQTARRVRYAYSSAAGKGRPYSKLNLQLQGIARTQ